MNRHVPRLVVLAGAAVACACASAPRPRWVPANGDYAPDSGRFAVRFPDGWMLLATPKIVMASRDGTLLQQIDVRTHEAGKPLGSSTKKVVSRGMLPQEVAEVVQDAIVSSPGMQGAAMTENGPAEIAGQPGFRLAFAYKDAEGLRIRAVVYGLLAGDVLYQLSYRAPERYYFARDVDTFERVRASFRVTTALAGAAGSQ